MTYVAHAIRVNIGPANIDIDVELTFNETVSLKERKLMDRDQNGSIDRAEMASYLAELEPILESGIQLTIGAHAVELLMRYEPELDLLGAQTVMPEHHVLKLAFFARISTVSAAVQEVVLQDHLWADAPALCSFQAAGTDGIEVQVTSPRRVLSNRQGKIDDRMVRIMSAAPTSALPPSGTFH
jgi:hypothetical protein